MADKNLADPRKAAKETEQSKSTEPKKTTQLTKLTDPQKLDSHKSDPHKSDPHKSDPHKSDPYKSDFHKSDPQNSIGPLTSTEPLKSEEPSKSTEPQKPKQSQNTTELRKPTEPSKSAEPHKAAKIDGSTNEGATDKDPASKESANANEDATVKYAEPSKQLFKSEIKEPSQTNAGPKLPFPKIVKIHIANTFLYMVVASLRSSVAAIYYADGLEMGEKKAMTIMHSIPYLSTLVSPAAAIIADNKFGYYWQHVIPSLICIPMNAITPFTTIQSWNLPAVAMVITSLVIMNLVNAFSAVCLGPLIGDQFILPQQKDQYQSFLFISYWLNNIGQSIGMFLGPYLRTSIHCFGKPYCYAVPYFPSVFSNAIYVFVFLIFRTWFIKNPPNKKNALWKTCKLVAYARKQKRLVTEKKKHLLDYAEGKYSQHFINDVKRLKMMYIFFALPIVYSLISQEMTLWTYLAKRMDSDIGFYDIQPDQLQLLNTLFCVILIPAFQYGLYPVMKKKQFMHRPLARIAVGGILYSTSYLICGFLSLKLEKELHPQPESGEGQLRIYNTMDCDLIITTPTLDEEPIEIEKLDFYHDYNVKVGKQLVFPFDFSCGEIASGREQLVIIEKEMDGFYFKGDGRIESYSEEMTRVQSGKPLVTTLVNSKHVITFNYKIKDTSIKISSSDKIEKLQLYSGTYSLYLNDDKEATLKDFKLKMGGIYTVLVIEVEDGEFESKLHTVTGPNSVHVLWLAPEYFIDVCGEILVSLAVSEFVYTQSPITMKACVLVMVSICMTIGNCLVSLLEVIFSFKNIATKFFLYSTLGFVNQAVLIVFVIRYRYVEESNKTGQDISDSTTSL